MPRQIQEWAVLYEAGYTLKRLALETGWHPALNKRRRVPGTFSPATIRAALLDWGVVLRKPGGRGSTKGSVLVRLAELERRVKEIERWRPAEDG